MVLSVLLGCLPGCGGDAEYGAACTTSCAGGLLCVPSFPGGYCSSRCGGGASCGAGSICDPTLADGLCLAECSASSECREGYQCFRGGCRPACMGDLDCGDGGRCVAGTCMGSECTTAAQCDPGEECLSGSCVPGTDAGMMEMPDAAGTLGDGASCTASSQCISGLCLPASRGGVCSEPCTDASACFALVPFSAGCGPVDVDGGRLTACIPYDSSGLADGASCSSDAQCASQTCSVGLCTEACATNSDCTAGETCENLAWSGATFSGCGFPPRSGAVEVIELDLGMHTISAATGTANLAFGVPSDAISTTLRAEHVSGSALDVGFYTVEAPNGMSLYSLNGFSDLIDQPIRWYPTDGGEAIAMLIPNTTTDRFAFQIGRYPYEVVAFGAAGSGSVAVHLTALVKRAAGRTVTAGELDLAVHLVGVGLNATTARTDTRLQAMLTRMDSILSRVGVSLGTITYHDVPAASAAALAVIDTTDGPDSELAQLFRLSAGRTGRVLPLFLVRGINAGGDGFNTLGIAGGIPGGTALYGTGHSGVVVSFDPGVVGGGTAGGTAAGHIAAHECSHFLGLFHVTERLRACATGESPSGGTCLPFGATDVIADTTLGDRSNLMNWSIQGGGSNDRVSAGQGFVLLRSPLTH